VTPSTVSPDALGLVLRRQGGLVTTRQLMSYGWSSGMIARRLRAPNGRWLRVLPHVYATFDHELSEGQRWRAALLYGGDSARLTGVAALRARRLRHLPSELTTDSVEIAVPRHRSCADRDFVVVRRTSRPVTGGSVDGYAAMSVARATVDAGIRCASLDTALALLSTALVNKKTSLAAIEAELDLIPRRFAGHLPDVLSAARAGAQSVPESGLLDLLAADGFPTPAVNEPICINGRWLIPDVRLGRLIVEVESREFHLLTPGAWEATQLRSTLLRAADYYVLPVTPEQIRDSPRAVLAAIRSAHVEVNGLVA
jgi:hypothetical protein